MEESGPGPIARAIRARRIELDLSVEDAAVEARIHVVAWRLLEQGVTMPSPLTLRAVCRVLGWTPATIDSLVHGELSVDGDGEVVVDLDRWPEHPPDEPRPSADPAASIDLDVADLDVAGLDVAGLSPAQLAEVQLFIDELRRDDLPDDER
jgi:transcriptional regulator with XRE-family HTH domain